MAPPAHRPEKGVPTQLMDFVRRVNDFVQPRAKTSRPWPVSRNDFMLERTRGQPFETLPAMVEPVLNRSCVTVRHTEFPTFSIWNVTRDLSFRLSGSAQVKTRRFGGALSITSPVIQTSFSGLRCSHFEPFFQSETFVIPAQYCRVNFGLLMASQVFFGVERIYVV